MNKLIQLLQEGARVVLYFGRYPAYGIQWISRHLLLWLLIAFALIGIPSLYYTGAIGIEVVNKLGRYICFAILAISLDLIWGYGGMLCLCQSLFFALGGYAMGMYLAHHGGPEGIIDANGWGKIPACLYVVYPYRVGEVPTDAIVPWFWKPFWTLPMTVLLGLAIPGFIAGLIGFSIFRSRVRGVFFAVLTQAIVLAFWLIFSMNNMLLCGTNGLTRFDRVILGSQECVEVVVNLDKLTSNGLSDSKFSQALRRWSGNNPSVTLTGSGTHFVIALDKSLHVWNEYNAIREIRIGDNTDVKIGDVASVEISGFKLTNPNVKLGLYVISAFALIGIYFFCLMLIKSRFGRVLVAMRDNENRLRFSGFEPFAFKTIFFSLSAMIAGLSGILYAPQMLIFTPTSLEPKESILVVIWVAVGGRGSLSGPILGALTIAYGYDYLTSNSPDAWPFVLGALVVFVTRLPQGVIGLWNKWLELQLHPSLTNKSKLIRPAAALAENFTPGESRWYKVIIAFGIVSVVFSTYLAFELARYGGPFAGGLMKTGSRQEIVNGILLVGVAICSIVQLPASIGTCSKQPWAMALSTKIFKGILTLLVGLILWSFLINSFSRNRGLGGWISDGLRGSFELVKSFPPIIVAGFWAATGLAILRLAPKSIWAVTDRRSHLPDNHVTVPASPGTHSQLGGAKSIDFQSRECDFTSNSDAPLLHLRGLKVFFDGFKALDVNEFSIKNNELNVIIGPNGAGKTTLCDVISGKTRPTEGSIWFAGRDITGVPEVQIARLGIGRKFQTPTLFDSLTVYENMELSLPGRSSLINNFGFQPSVLEDAQIFAILERVGLAGKAKTKVAFLSHGQRQWLEISMLILARPKLLLVDEPAAGLTDQETELTADLLLELRKDHSIIVIEHDMEFVRRLASPVTVLIDGSIEDQGTMQEIQGNPKVKEAYLGR